MLEADARGHGGKSRYQERGKSPYVTIRHWLTYELRSTIEHT